MDSKRNGDFLDPARFRQIPPRRAGADPVLNSEHVFLSPAMQAVARGVRRVAGSDASVLLTGERGTGKKVVAELIHRLSPHTTGPLVKVNCAALPPNLFESELFGVVRGAAAGAGENRLGRFRRADGGTLLLDELTELPLEAQGKLLRVLQTGRFRPLGARRELAVNCRVIAATNLRPALAVPGKKLRLDLYEWLSLVIIHLPPLRERREDIPELVQRFVARFSRLLRQPVREVTPAAQARLREHPWPGNIHQLENALHRAILLGEGPCVDVPDLGQLEPARLPGIAVARPLTRPRSIRPRARPRSVSPAHHPAACFRRRLP